MNWISGDFKLVAPAPQGRNIDNGVAPNATNFAMQGGQPQVETVDDSMSVSVR
jgi:hypothetical protein